MAGSVYIIAADLGLAGRADISRVSSESLSLRYCGGRGASSAGPRPDLYHSTVTASPATVQPGQTVTFFATISPVRMRRSVSNFIYLNGQNVTKSYST